MGNLMNPCVDYCFLRYGKQYDINCDNTCEFARVIKKKIEN